jgi:hypothetical protein
MEQFGISWSFDDLSNRLLMSRPVPGAATISALDPITWRGGGLKPLVTAPAGTEYLFPLVGTN